MKGNSGILYIYIYANTRQKDGIRLQGTYSSVYLFASITQTVGQSTSQLERGTQALCTEAVQNSISVPSHQKEINHSPDGTGARPLALTQTGEHVVIFPLPRPPPPSHPLSPSPWWAKLVGNITTNAITGYLLGYTAAIAAANPAHDPSTGMKHSSPPPNSSSPAKWKPMS